jgi:hypothetical protein
MLYENNISGGYNERQQCTTLYLEFIQKTHNPTPGGLK